MSRSIYVKDQPQVPFSRKLLHYFGKFRAVVVLILLVLVYAIFKMVPPSFFTIDNITGTLKACAASTILVMGMLMVIKTGQVDFSLGSAMGLGCATYFVAAKWWGWGSGSSLGLLPCVLLVIAVGCVFGLINGLAVTYGNVPSFVGTIAVGMIESGLANSLTTSITYETQSNNSLMETGPGFELLNKICSMQFLGLSLMAWVAIIICIATGLFLNRSVHGRLVTAYGYNKEAVEHAGLRPNFYQILPFVLASGISAFGGLLLCGTSTIATANAGSGYEMTAIVACMIGGANFYGGDGSVANSYLGMLIMALISRTSQKYQSYIIIVLVLVLNLINHYTRKKEMDSKDKD